MRDILAVHGYAPSPSITRDQVESYLRYEDHFVLFNKDENINIDLHWDVLTISSLVPLYLKDVSHLRTVQLKTKDFIALSPEDTVVHHCLHATSHCWMDLEHISCLAHLLHHSEDIDWNKLWLRTTKLRCRRMVLLGLYLVGDYMVSH